MRKLKKIMFRKYYLNLKLHNPKSIEIKGQLNIKY